jgi:hypothetical protein
MSSVLIEGLIDTLEATDILLSIDFASPIETIPWDALPLIMP